VVKSFSPLTTQLNCRLVCSGHMYMGVHIWHACLLGVIWLTCVVHTKFVVHRCCQLHALVIVFPVGTMHRLLHVTFVKQQSVTPKVYGSPVWWGLKMQARRSPCRFSWQCVTPGCEMLD
jgi:hypothetical protein